MDKVPIPVDLLAVGRPIPVDVWGEGGQLLLRRGQVIESEQHKERLRSHHAQASATEAHAWQRAYERRLWEMLRDGASVEAIVGLPMPSEILQHDYREESELKGGWLDLQEVLQGILYHGALALDPLRRLAGLEAKALALLEADADDSLFGLLQALSREDLGYCATHALLCMAVCELSARKLGLDALLRQSLRGAALVMNIGMAAQQDAMARQSGPLSEAQRALVREHPQKGVEILRRMDVDDATLLALVRWHHAPETKQGNAHQQACRLLGMADVFVAKMAARKTRAPLSPLNAAKSIYLGAQGERTALSTAMAAAVGFYPPGSYVRLVNGELAVVIQRGARANTPWVLGLSNADGIPQTHHQAKDTAQPAHAIREPVSFRQVRIAVSPERVRKERARIARFGAASGP